MNYLLLLISAISLIACGKPDALDDAITTGNIMNATMQKCIDHMKANKGDTSIPECNASKQFDAYMAAKAKVRNASPALEAIDQKSAILRLEAVGLVFGQPK